MRITTLFLSLSPNRTLHNQVIKFSDYYQLPIVGRVFVYLSPYDDMLKARIELSYNLLSLVYYHHPSARIKLPEYEKYIQAMQYGKKYNEPLYLTVGDDVSAFELSSTPISYTITLPLTSLRLRQMPYNPITIKIPTQEPITLYPLQNFWTMLMYLEVWKKYKGKTCHLKGQECVEKRKQKQKKVIFTTELETMYAKTNRSKIIGYRFETEIYPDTSDKPYWRRYAVLLNGLFRKKKHDSHILYEPSTQQVLTALPPLCCTKDIVKRCLYTAVVNDTPVSAKWIEQELQIIHAKASNR